MEEEEKGEGKRGEEEGISTWKGGRRKEERWGGIDVREGYRKEGKQERG